MRIAVCVLGGIVLVGFLSACSSNGRPGNDLATGFRHTCVVTAVGGIKCWGSNEQGQLGNGGNADSATPVDVSGLTKGVTGVAAGGNHSCAWIERGGVKCWGGNGRGALGNGVTADSGTPVDVVGLDDRVADLAVGRNHTCAVTVEGSLKCWGGNYNGQLGDGTTTDRTTPVDVIGLSSGIATVSGSGDHTCAVTTEGIAKCWGGNWKGQLGDGTMTDRTTPVNVIGLTMGVDSISGGGAHSCAVSKEGGVKCWGHNFQGQLGGRTSGGGTPADVAGLSSGVVAVSTRISHTCVVTIASEVKCWGSDDAGQVSGGVLRRSGRHRGSPRDLCFTDLMMQCGAAEDNILIDVTQLSAGSHHTCAVTGSGNVVCWGLNDAGQVGEPQNSSR